MTERKKKHPNRQAARVGPAPLPTPLRVLDGSATQADLDREVKPEPSGVPRRPPWLSDEGAKVWRSLARSMHKKGLLDDWNAVLFAVWCNEVGNYVAAAKLVNTTTLLATGHRNVLRKNPALSVQRDAVPAIRLLGAEFGLTPAARAGLDLIGELPLDQDVRKLLSG